MPEVAGASGALFTDPHAPAEVAAALTRLWQEPALRRALQAGGAANLSRFSWERSADVLWQALKSALTESGA